MMAGYIRSKGQLLNRPQIRKHFNGLIQPITKGEERTQFVQEIQFHIMQHIMDINYTVIKTRSFLDMAAHYLLSTIDAVPNSSNVLHA